MFKKIVAMTLVVVSLFAVNCFVEKKVTEEQPTTIICEYDCDFDEFCDQMDIQWENIEDLRTEYDWNGTVHHLVELKVSPAL